jgi:hypothetical protein
MLAAIGRVMLAAIAWVMLAAIGCDGPAIVHAAAVQWRSIRWRLSGAKIYRGGI